jgi:hypothetical protein
MHIQQLDSGAAAKMTIAIGAAKMMKIGPNR